MKKEKIGVLSTAFSYFLWGILPVYWKWLQHVGADEILANRVFWSFWFMILYLFLSNRWNGFRKIIQEFRENRRMLYALGIASILISMNWFIYIFAVNSNQMVEASLGYYINPLVSVLLGVFILKEKLNKFHLVSFLLALTGVLILTISYGSFPWIAFGLAFSFGLYGLAKKVIKVNAAIGLTLETLIIVPIAFLYMLYLGVSGESFFISDSFGTTLLLVGAGAVTAIPLLLFGKGAQSIPLYMVGFLQYIAPTITLLLGVIVYKEKFTQIDFIAFLFIWSALMVFTVSRLKWFSVQTERA
ncbi:EamA family transporter RarD [Bacillus sp. 2205SS5-2]|uniref:EamA family transporter RarD n=1 Tax=Bacillus sp. 2205SS5-2 TaxID=3109031 RepID=UPI003004B638